MENNLKNMSTADLKAELERREAAASEAALNARIEKNMLFLSRRAVLLQLMEHGRTSCSDENPINGNLNPGSGRTAPRCYKCALINLTVFDVEHVEMDLGFSIRALNA